MAVMAIWAWVLARPKYRARLRPNQAFFGAEDLLHPEPALRDQLVEAPRRSPQRPAARRLSHDPVLVAALQRCPVGLAGIGLVGQDPLAAGALDHRLELGALGDVGRGDVDLVDEALLVDAGKTLVAQRALAALLDPGRVRIGAMADVRRVGRCLVFRPVLGNALDMGPGPGRAGDQRGPARGGLYAV